MRVSPPGSRIWSVAASSRPSSSRKRDLVVLAVALTAAPAAACHARSPQGSDPPSGVWAYDLAMAPGGRELRVRATLPPSGAVLHVDDRAQGFVRDVEL